LTKFAGPRLRMLAGPNGSGKSFLVPLLQTEVNLGTSVNADEIEAILSHQFSAKLLNLHNWDVSLTDEDLRRFAARPDSQRLPREQLTQLRIEQNVLLLGEARIDSYLAAWIAELLRVHLLLDKRPLTFETVMSHPSKLEFLHEAQQIGYRTYLYFVATADPLININRVRARVSKGGHAVAENKIVDRYHRSLKLLRPALKFTDRAYIFDNSGDEPHLIAEVTNGREVTYQTTKVPMWVQKILS
jgi:predicted ABC-type ATPase